MNAEIAMGIVLLVDKACQAKIGIIDKVEYYPTWIEDKRHYNPADYPKATHIYGIDVHLSKGVHIIGWAETEQINYIDKMQHPGKPQTYLAIDLEWNESHRYSLKNMKDQVYYPLSNQNNTPKCQKIYQAEMAHSTINVISERGTPLSLFTLAYLACMPEFFGNKMNRLEFGAAKGKVTKHILTLD